MELAKLTSKGQVTIPKKIREALHVGEGDRIAFIEQGDYVIMTKADLQKLNDLEDVLSDQRFHKLIEQAGERLEE